ncbi:MAG: S9 family peptidase, partial [Altibacter sp.]|nr:S9 family peptidase [Altibacter sp.]
MKRVLILCTLSILFFACKEKEKKETEVAETVEQYTIEQFMDNENAFANGYSPDKSKVLMTSNRSGIYNMYTVPSDGGEWMPVTKSDSASVFGISYFPEDDRILFRMDGNGDEIYKIYVKDGEEIQRLTPAQNVRALFRGWSKDGKRFFYGSNERDPRYMDHYEMDITNFKSKMLYKNEEGMEYGGMSDDGKYMALSKAVNTNDVDLFLLNTETNTTTKINDTISGNAAQDFSPNGEAFYYTTDKGAEFSYLMKYNLNEGTKVKAMDKPWDITNFYFTEDGTYQLLFTNEDAETVLEVVEVVSGDRVDFPKFDGQSIYDVDFSKDESMALLSVGGSHTPSNTYSYNLKTKEVVQLTDVLNKAIDANDLVAAEVVRFKSFDGLEIPAIYYEPKQASKDN